MRFDAPILLYGAGREARSTRAFLQKVAPKTQVFVTADSGEVEIDDAQFIAPDKLPEAIEAQKFGLIVKSPGVSLYKPIFDIARKAGIEVTSNLNLWAQQYRKGHTVIAVTGTKGKSTTATLISLFLTHSGLDAGLAGNVGVAPLDIGDKHKIIVFELSSYQTADMDFTPDISGLTNLYPEHIDWHGTRDHYYLDKLNLIDRDGKFRVAITPQAQEIAMVRDAIHHDTGRIMPLNPLIEDALVKAVEKSKLKGAHNLENARLATRLAMAAGANLDGVLAGIKAFIPLQHRLEEHRIGDIIFVDDSISTTPEATSAALAAYQGQKIALIAGGYDRQQDYAKLATELIKAGVVLLICLPVTGKRLAKAAESAAPDLNILEVEDLAAAMAALEKNRRTFDTVILSPGAPSYNQFKSFDERGETFIALARSSFDT